MSLIWIPAVACHVTLKTPAGQIKPTLDAFVLKIVSNEPEPKKRVDFTPVFSLQSNSESIDINESQPEGPDSYVQSGIWSFKEGFETESGSFSFFVSKTFIFSS